MGRGPTIEAIANGPRIFRRPFCRALRRHTRMGRAGVPQAHQRLGAGPLLRNHLNHRPMQRTVSPVDGNIYVEREVASADSIERALERAQLAQKEWRSVSVADRAAILSRFCDLFA